MTTKHALTIMGAVAFLICAALILSAPYLHLSIPVKAFYVIAALDIIGPGALILLQAIAWKE